MLLTKGFRFLSSAPSTSQSVIFARSVSLASNRGATTATARVASMPLIRSYHHYCYWHHTATDSDENSGNNKEYKMNNGRGNSFYYPTNSSRNKSIPTTSHALLMQAPWRHTANKHQFGARAFSTSTRPVASAATTDGGGSEEVVKAVLDVVQRGDMKAIGLGANTPVGVIQNILETIHVDVGLPWFGSIIVLTLAIRLMLFPLIVKTMKNTARLSNIRPQIEYHSTRMNDYNKVGDKERGTTEAIKLQKLFQEHNCHPLRSLILPLLQMPIFISFFFALRSMASLPIESLKTGGILWFTDLTVPDPYFVLPTVSALTFLLTFELGADGISNQHQAQFMKTLFRALAVSTIFFTAKIPAVVFCYWFSSNMFSLVQLFLFKVTGLKKVLGIPDVVQHPSTSQKKSGPVESFKSHFESAKYNSAVQNLQKSQENLQKENLANPPPVYRTKYDAKRSSQ